MSIITNDTLNKITSQTSGKINNKIIEFTKEILFTKLFNYITAPKELDMIKNKISNIKIELLSNDFF